MKRFRRALLVIGAVVCVTSSLLASPAQAASSAAAHRSVVTKPAYWPGNASAIAPINAGGDVAYKCQFNSWVSTPIEWKCELWTTTGDFIDGHEGESYNQSFGTPGAGWYHKPSQLGKAYCTRAQGLNLDGGDSDQKCS